MKCVEVRRQQSVGGSSRFGHGPHRAVDQLAVGVGGDCGERVLVAALCVCVFLLVLSVDLRVG